MRGLFCLVASVVGLVTGGEAAGRPVIFAFIGAKALLTGVFVLMGSLSILAGYRQLGTVPESLGFAVGEEFSPLAIIAWQRNVLTKNDVVTITGQHPVVGRPIERSDFDPDAAIGAAKRHPEGL